LNVLSACKLSVEFIIMLILARQAEEQKGKKYWEFMLHKSDCTVLMAYGSKVWEYLDL